MQRVSRITKGVIRHRLLEEARATFLPMCRDATDGLVLLVIGPTQSGKSILFGEIVSALRDAFRDQRAGAIPIVDLQIETVSDGRAKPKWLGIELLKQLKHPIYEHIGSLDEGEYYFPSKGRDEGTIRIALKEAMSGRYARRVCLDELHLLTRTKDPELRASILESIKSSCAIDRSLIGCGGYEIAYKGLFDSPHFCGRVITYDFGHYDANTKQDVAAWMRILKTYSAHLKLSPDTLLLDMYTDLLYATNGVIGLLDKLLWSASFVAQAKQSRINKNILFSGAPPEKERAAVALDIELGKAALKACATIAINDQTKETDRPAAKERENRGSRQPFERSPNRKAAMDVKIHADD